MNGKQKNCDLKKRPIEFAVRVLDVVESLPNSIPSFPSSLHHSLLDIRYSILTARELAVNHPTGAGVARYASGCDKPIEACKLGHALRKKLTEKSEEP